LREINHGGMGTVYLAERDDDIYQKRVAIKILRGGFYSTELRRRFYEERRILARLDHPNITKLIDGGTTDDGSPYYVMDYVEGLALDDYSERNDLSTGERLRLFRQVCEAVQYAHRNLVIHRDLKPSNILVNAEGVPQLLDFGIAKVFQEEEQAEATRTNLRVMTPEYASPEQLNGKAVTTASDIYSLGVILYELLTGSRPFHFKADSLEEIIRAICETNPPKPSEVKSEPPASAGGSYGLADASSNTRPLTQAVLTKALKGDLDNIVLKALSKEPERRYSSVEQFSEDIRRHLEGLPVLARPDTFHYRVSKFVRRNKLGVAMAAGVALFLLAGAIAIVRQTHVAARAAQVAAAQRDKAQHAQAKAQREQAKAERINKFFQEMLAHANPSWYAPGFNKSRDLSVVAALDEAARRIENELQEEPEVKADILLTIGDTYASISRFESSERALEQALKLRREVLGEDNVKTADALFLLANTKRALGKREEMLRLYKEAYPIYRRHPTEESQFPYFLLDYAGTFSEKGNHAEHIRLTAEAVEMLKKLKGENSNAVAMARMNLAAAYFMWGDLDNALQEAQAAYEILPDETNTIWRLGQTYFLRGELEKAEPLLLKTLSRFEQNNALPWQATTLVWLAQLYQERGDHRKAEDLMNRAIVIDRRLYASNNPTLFGNLIMKGLILTRAGKAGEGETLIRDALRQLNGEQQKNHEGTLGECLLAQKRYAEAEPLLLNHYQRLKETQHPASPRLKTAHERLQTLTKFKLRTTVD
jgi:serine/threonine-protein kinase